MYFTKIANVIKNRREYLIDLSKIEELITDYEDNYYEAIRLNLSDELSDEYADNISLRKFSKSYIYGFVLMKKYLRDENFSSEYIKQFVYELECGDNLYDELDERTFLPNAKDYYRILEIFGMVDCHFVAKQNNLTFQETNRLKNISNKFYFGLPDSKKGNRLLAMISTIDEFNFNRKSPILNWDIE